jgi:two-component system sensor kinase FixL
MSTRTSLLLALGLLIGTAFLDWVTGPLVAVTIVYVVPICFATWKLGRRAGLAMAAASGVVWLGLEWQAHLSFLNPLVLCWNGLIRTLTFCLVSVLQSELLARKRSQAELQQQAGVLESILSSMGDGVVVCDASGRLMHINPAARRILRIPANTVNVVAWLQSPERSLPGGIAGDGAQTNPLIQALRGQIVDAAELCFPDADRPQGVWLSVTGRPLVDHDGQVAGGVMVFSDITARKELERQIAAISDREQQRIGEDLHDGLCQHLVSIALAARTLAAKLSDQDLAEREDATEIAELVSQSIAQARSVARGLCLVQIEAGGLSSALEELATQVRSRHRIACQFVNRTVTPILDETLATNLFRIAQEGVNNAIKHAQPQRITVTLSGDPQQIRLTIEDDGVGLSGASQPGGGMGLHIMNYRARILGATLQLAPRKGGGTIVTCAVRRLNGYAEAELLKSVKSIK